MDVRSNGRRALVAGSASGHGRATAAMLAGEGVTVTVRGRAAATAGGTRFAGGRAGVGAGGPAAEEGAVARAPWGRVIQPTAGHRRYDAARHDLSLPREPGGSGVTSSAVAPGAILVDVVREPVTRGARLETEQADAGAWFPDDTGRFGRPENTAAVVHLAGPYADAVTGATTAAPSVMSDQPSRRHHGQDLADHR